ncbi:DUF4389 domain-containing protein [Streptomyces sp. NPDC058268]|uniref:DUF4389 domain-containing protein n=1 Tax=Streptomyces sp. NPDC058268 TaxID=3346413 RepID=UPI0036F03DF2
MTEQNLHPVQLQATLDPRLSRGLWLIKWLLALPHLIVLFFLWITFVLLTVVAFFAILITGRYPRALFDFNVGVMRWSWRVQYYAYGALGTDRYPPFSLADVPDYPTHLDVAYPEQLSRGKVLVKWWLLAIPHYLILGVLLGAAQHPDLWSSIGFIKLLVLFAGIGLLFTGRYPKGLFELIIGFNRWVIRVTAYAALMTDVYPPFRLDMGGRDPGPARCCTDRGAW